MSSSLPPALFLFQLLSTHPSGLLSILLPVTDGCLYEIKLISCKCYRLYLSCDVLLVQCLVVLCRAVVSN